MAIDVPQVALRDDATTVAAPAKQRDPLRLVVSVVIAVELVWVGFVALLGYAVWGLLGW